MSEYENSVNQSSTDNKTTINLKGMSLADLELYGIKTALLDCRGNISLTAKRLGITRTTLYKKIEHFGLA